MSDRIYIIFDTNVVIGKRKELIKMLNRYKNDVVIALPQIPVDESLGRSLYDVACKRDDRTDKFLRHLEDIVAEFRNNGLDVENVPVAFFLGVSRLDFGYLVDEDYWGFLSKAIQYYMGKDGRYWTTLMNIVHCIRAKQKLRPENITDYFEVFLWALHECCHLQASSVNCRNQCRALYGVLGDLLILSVAYYIYRTRRVAMVVVSDDKVLRNAVEMLGKTGYYDERLVKCTSYKSIEKAIETMRQKNKNQ